MPQLDFGEILRLIIYGVVEGITEWLPVSSTGHLLILEKFLTLKMSEDFLTMFRIVIQLAAILAVIIYFWQKLWPLKSLETVKTVVAQSSAYWRERPKLGRQRYFRISSKLFIDRSIIQIWLWVVLASIPAAVVGFFGDEFFEKYFYNSLSVAIALILVALIFLLVERRQEGQGSRYEQLADLPWRFALLIGLAQMLAGVFPGVSRSGACIIAGLALGLSRPLASEISFFMAIPVMLGAGLLKLLRLTAEPQSAEWLALWISSVVAFVVSLLTIKYFMNFIKRHDFRTFAYYRIVLGIAVFCLSFI